MNFSLQKNFDQEKFDQLAKIIWNYMLINQPLKKADCIIGFGSHDLRVAERAAELFHQKYAPFIIFSGGLITNQGLINTGWQKSEAKMFTQTAIKLGVPQDKIMLEKKASNTAENIRFTKELLKINKIEIASGIIVHKPYMERRTYAAIKKQWPEIEPLITSPKLSYDEYMLGVTDTATEINIMLGDLQRIKIYAKKGWQIQQKIPGKIWQAFEELVKMGYDKRLLQIS
jgi:uncharacterized SAM-binding protein YcdF (DUF218 family)